MIISAQGFAPALRRAGAIFAIAAIALPVAAFADEAKLVLHSATGDYDFNVEVVDTPESRAQGLMFRTELADDAGMLFDFKEERPVSFWMRNTFIPLDMIFVGADGVIKNIHVNARPQDPTSIPSDGAVQFVLEIPGGRSAEIGLKAGDTMEHDRVVATPAN
ncbi:DUF192 domain-containing protein [Devosia lacusdianchii]|uniref:DUF192 domain-containing protein n=1 Tax=Devosia lacusdianchii TaxID=2917991 RepID=UPI001F060A4A|nr:DUF192 domain-containing protein [Devosia sp. JXJ CY 41]